MCNTPKCLLHTSSLLSSQSIDWSHQEPIEQPDIPRKPEGSKPGRREHVHHRGCAACPRAKGHERQASSDSPRPPPRPSPRRRRHRPCEGRRSPAITPATPSSGPLGPAHFRPRRGTKPPGGLERASGRAVWGRDPGRRAGGARPDLGVAAGAQGSAQPWRAEGGRRWASSSSWAPALSSPPSCTPCTGRRPRSPKSSRSVLEPAWPQSAHPCPR